jgi:hypothetical protein
MINTTTHNTMTITKLIQASFLAASRYETAKEEYESNCYGEFDHHLKGVKLCKEMMEADAAIESHLLKILSDNH